MAHSSAYFFLNEVDGTHDIKAIKSGLDTLPGVMSVSVNAQDGKVAVDYDDTGVTREQLQHTLSELGYRISSLNIDQLTD
ncbi:MAG: heavy-metal-associated domain-containing protein [Clostridia bacterium]|nr:heavy-metal-associated domain-containing protein [Clostridia bacterium]